MRIYRAGIVGLTGIGAGARPETSDSLVQPMPHSHASACALLPNVELVAACDLKPELLARFQENWGSVWPEARVYADYREMLAEARLDLLSVCTSDHAHARIVVDACAAAVRGIFCEKPIATSLEDADRMIAAAEAAGVPLQIDHTRRWYPIWTHVREQIRAGEIGQVTGISAVMGSPRAMLFRNGTHLVDTVVMLAESRPAWVFAELEPGFESYGVYGGDGGRDPSLEPGAHGYIHFENGIRAWITCSKQAVAPFAVEVFGTEGRLTVSDLQGAVLHGAAGSRSLRIPQYAVTGIAAGMDELIRSLEGRGASLSSPAREARRTLQVLLGFLQSQVRGNIPVRLQEGAA